MKKKVLRRSAIIPKELYVKRDADKQIKNIIEDMGRPGYILVARQMGKTSLLINAKRDLEDENNIFVYLDLLSKMPKNSRECFRSIIDIAVDSHENIFYKVKDKIDQNRKAENLSPHQEHEYELRTLLKAVEAKIVISLDEIGMLADVEFSDEIFAQIRSIYFSRINFQEYERLTYILAGVAEPSVLIKNRNISPFNIGEKIYLDDFSEGEFITFLHQAKLSFTDKVAERIFYWTNGNPRITWDLCSELEDIHRHGIEIDSGFVDGAVKKLYLSTVNEAPIDNIREVVQNDKEIRDAIILIKNNKGGTLSNEIKNKLYLAGIIKSDYHSQETSIKNRVIEQSLSDKWLVSTEHYILSQAQLRLWMLAQLDDALAIYNIPFAFKMEGKLNKAAFEKAFISIVHRHESLRTTFIKLAGNPLQKIHEKMDFRLHSLDLRNEIEAEKRVRELAREDAVKPFDLIEGPLFRVTLIQLAEARHVFLFNIHHIIFDGYSIGILMQELSHFYQCYVDNVSGSLKPLDYQYRDYADWQYSLLKNKVFDIHREYWLNKLSEKIPVLNLPSDFPRPPLRVLSSDMISFSLDSEKMGSILNFYRGKDVDLLVILLAAVKILLYRYTGYENIFVGSPVSGRNNPKLIGQLGLYENKLVLQDYLKGHMSFEYFLGQVKATKKEAHEHEVYPFEKLIADLGLSFDLSHTPLFNVMVMLQKIDEVKFLFKDVDVSPFSIKSGISEYDLNFSFLERKEELLLGIEYNTDLFLKSSIVRMGGHFIRLVDSILNADRDITPIDRLDILTEEEYQKILYEFNDTTADFLLDKTIVELFEEQVVKAPDKIVLVFGDKRFSLRELNNGVNLIANYLREKYSIEQDEVVGIIFDYSEWTIIGILGILKAGAAYVPIDRDYPYERILYMIDDCDCKLTLITEDSDSVRYNDSIESYGVRSKFLNIGEIQNKNYHEPSHIRYPQRLAYVIYTSGSTGRPKGVMIEHHSVVNLVSSFSQKIEIYNGDYLHISLIGSFAFDFSVLQMFYALLQGHSLHLVSRDIFIDSYELIYYLKRRSIDVVSLTPSLFSNLVNLCFEIKASFSARYFWVGGEVLPAELIKMFYSIPGNKDIFITNVYGPAESCVVSSLKSLDQKCVKAINNVPIGSPLNNTEFYILDNHLQLVPIGIIGEIFIAGEGLARGYINRIELTREKFIIHPFKKGHRLYCTGDIGKWLPDGNIEFVGRKDFQIKVRGFRIELKEIESQLLTHEKIKEVVVLTKEKSDGDRYLCAYIIANGKLLASELRKYLYERLPDYMIPTFFVQIEVFPLTSNGKVDRRALPEPWREDIENYIAPRNEIEKNLTLIWSEVLGIDEKNIGIENNFFNLGGHSLNAISLTSKIYKGFNVRVPLVEIFKNPTIWRLGEYIQREIGYRYSYLKPVEEKEYYVVSSAQRRFFLLNQVEENSIINNMTYIAVIEEELEPDRVETAFMEVIRRHEILRTSFLKIDDETVQRVHENVDFGIEYTEMQSPRMGNGNFTTEDSGEKKVFDAHWNSVARNIKTPKILEKLLEDFVRPFDLSRAPLLRIGLMKIDNRKYLLIIDVHEIVADSPSQSILVEEFILLYSCNELPDLRIQYKDYSEWEYNVRSEEATKAQEEYWLKEFSGELPQLTIPTDYMRPAIHSFDCDTLNFSIDKDMKIELDEFARQEGVTLFMLLLSIYNVLLFKYCSQEDIIVGTPTFGRRHTDLGLLIGRFENILPLRNYPERDKTFVAFLEEIKRKALQAYENQDYRFEDLMDKIALRKRRNSERLFDTIFALELTYLNQEKKKESESLKLKLFNLSVKQSVKYDITLIGRQVGDKLCFKVIYPTNLFKVTTIEGLIADFKEIIKEVLENKYIKLKDIALSSYRLAEAKLDIPQIDFGF